MMFPFRSATLALVLLCLPPSALASEAPICGVALGHRFENVRGALNVSSVGFKMFKNLEAPNRTVRAESFEGRFIAPCSEVAAQSVPEPTIVVAVAVRSPRNVLAIAFRPRAACAEAVSTLTKEYGAATSTSNEITEWRVPSLKRHVMVSNQDGQCWVHHLPFTLKGVRP
ncbi:hypothetical protein [Paucibacter sp. Y2R2-4]|uniref:hypothetical protein n=1 Tax=Paucibacter sp. Y2R2-4 TaxID=2893553 RepID=UPI0021E4479E|nr:hypothetical protein [Paucibacter sp. Y2R2-4]MCV2349496.1 hypothetical protein [Paucibacter sp. Y2R2-4]